jgi:hypothetical protein
MSSALSKSGVPSINRSQATIPTKMPIPSARGNLADREGAELNLVRLWMIGRAKKSKTGDDIDDNGMGSMETCRNSPSDCMNWNK